MNNRNLIWAVTALVAAIFLAGFVNKYLVDKIADRVIQKLQMEYSPSPYGPGIDPDKLDADKIFKK